MYATLHPKSPNSPDLKFDFMPMRRDFCPIKREHQLVPRGPLGQGPEGFSLQQPTLSRRKSSQRRTHRTVQLPGKLPSLGELWTNTHESASSGITSGIHAFDIVGECCGDPASIECVNGGGNNNNSYNAASGMPCLSALSVLLV